MDDYREKKLNKKCVIKQILKFEDYRKCLETLKLYQDHSKGLTVKYIVYLLKRVTGLH